ncbi:hypothetical protein FAZ15_14615 [Sphingobacterium olei]|uniref:Uncharacterized protein n=1 Tax=Sphingobacterium olei TaxID=2571155 RepID=A0A4U0NYZ6_9SPHI|nr:hypothetical protein [Sphingobacterium olei]TJZ60111.1 hypothetical protein FAZ15_14615 [Sphingobacterium olei]
MKTFLWIGFVLCGLQSVKAQTATEKQLQQEIVTLKGKLKEQAERTTILKEALDLRERGKEIKKEDVSIRITSLSQNQESGEVSVKGLITYHGTKKRNLQFVQQQVVDPQGNTYQTYKVVKPNAESEDVFFQDVTAEIPYAFLIKFESISEKLSALSLMRVQIYGDFPGSISNFDFKGLEVEW